MLLTAALTLRDEARQLIAAGTNPAQQKKIEKTRQQAATADCFKTVAMEWYAEHGAT